MAERLLDATGTRGDDGVLKVFDANGFGEEGFGVCGPFPTSGVPCEATLFEEGDAMDKDDAVPRLGRGKVPLWAVDIVFRLPPLAEILRSFTETIALD